MNSKIKIFQKKNHNKLFYLRLVSDICGHLSKELIFPQSFLYTNGESDRQMCKFLAEIVEKQKTRSIFQKETCMC